MAVSSPRVRWSVGHGAATQGRPGEASEKSLRGHLRPPLTLLFGDDRSIDVLEQGIQAVLDAVPGDFAVAVREVGGAHETLLLNEHESFHAASTMKVPVMIELYRQAREESFRLDDSIRVKNAFRSSVGADRFSLTPEEDSCEALYDHIGETRSIRTLMREMIAASSNLATNLLLEAVGAEAVTQTLRRYGAERIQVRRGVGDMRAYRRGWNNETSAHDLLVLFERIARGRAVSEEASQEMIDLLKQQQYTDMIPARLPEAVEVAHKTGWISGVRHDAGIVYVPGGPTYVLVFLSKGLGAGRTGKDACARVSRRVFDSMVGGE